MLFSHIIVGTNDLQRALRFYDRLMATLGVGPAVMDEYRFFYPTPHGIFSVSEPINGEPATFANGGTIGFEAPSPEVVEAWHAAGVAAGGASCEDPPGVRESRLGSLYLAYLRDPDGNKLCARHVLA
jgi:catechol 2,3-dioxygenase-like lactoylglutathione lyase family enzyme